MALSKLPSAAFETTGRRNLIINGAFEIAQRSTSEVTGAGYTTVDRWRFPNASQKSQQVDNDRDISIPKMLKVTSNSSGYGIAEHKIEDVTKTSGKTVTLSFWAKTSDYSNFRLYMYQDFGASGSSDVSVVDNATYFSVPDTGWNKYTATLTCPSVSGKTINAGNYLYFGIGPASGTASGVVYYSEVQLEVGDSASPFEHRSYGEELALCQRYFFQLTGGQYNRSDPTGYADTTTRAFYNQTTPVAMRATPSMTENNLTINGTGVTSISGVNKIGESVVSYLLNYGGSHTVGSLQQSYWDGTSNNYTRFDAEL